MYVHGHPVFAVATNVINSGSHCKDYVYLQFVAYMYIYIYIYIYILAEAAHLWRASTVMAHC